MTGTAGLWGGRFEGGLDPEFDAFNRSLPFDQRLVQEDILGSRAWARALGKAGVLSKEEVEALDGALESLSRELLADPAPLSRSDAEDVHAFVEAALTEKLGDLARKLHAGRSRNDQVATDLKLYLKTTVLQLSAGLEALVAELVALAQRTADWPMPGYTHLQRAQPVTVGHHALAYVEMLGRDHGRLRDATARMDTCPLGSGALAGSGFPVDRAQLASELGFHGGPTQNSLDAVSDRDHALELAFACSLIMVHLSRFAEDWIFFASPGCGFLRLSDAVSTGSSLMPQKKNPDGLELLRGKTGRVIGALQSLLITVKALPLAYNKDFQEDKEVLFDALDTVRACLRIATLCVQHAEFDREACQEACATGFLDATDLADLLVRSGVPFRDAHERVGQAVREALTAGVELVGLGPPRLRGLFPEIEVDLSTALSVVEVLGRRDLVGGTAPVQVRAAVEQWKERLAKW